MYERTNEVIARVNGADAAQRAAQGPVRAVMSIEVVGHIVGATYPANRGGPLAGQPMRRWALLTHYGDGTTSEFCPKTR